MVSSEYQSNCSFQCIVCLCWCHQFCIDIRKKTIKQLYCFACIHWLPTITSHDPREIIFCLIPTSTNRKYIDAFSFPTVNWFSWLYIWEIKCWWNLFITADITNNVCVCVCLCDVCVYVCMKSPNSLFWTISCPNVCNPKHCVNCVYSEVCIVVSTIKTCCHGYCLCYVWEGSCSCWLVTTLADYVKTLMQPLMEWSFINVRV